MSAPFSNCRFRECDLPGQCRGEGRCHHPVSGDRDFPAASEEADDPLTCDFCGAPTDDPWHTSDATRKHLHQCDACHADSGQKLTDEQIVQIGHEYFRTGHDPKAVATFVKAVRACFRASASAAVRVKEVQS